MQNTVDLKDGVIYVVYRGEQTVDSVDEVGQKLDGYIEALRIKNTPAKILIELSDDVVANQAARMKAISWIRSHDFEKMAVFASTSYILHAVSFLIAASGNEKIKVFDSLATSVSWLNQ